LGVPEKNIGEISFVLENDEKIHHVVGRLVLSGQN
jgi:hypothetical protein